MNRPEAVATTGDIVVVAGGETHKAAVGVTSELVAGGETLEAAVGVSRELFVVGNA